MTRKIQRSTERYQTFKWTQWIDGTYFLEYKNIEIKNCCKFSDDISFYLNDKYLIVHSSDAKPCEYVLAILKGKELKDYDIIKSFWEMTWMKIKITSK